MARFRIRTHWLDAPADEDLSEAERCTFARIALLVDDTALTQVGDDGEDAARGFVRGPASGLAEWIVESWVSLLWETHTPFPKSPGGGAGQAKVPTTSDAARWWRGRTTDLAAVGRWQQRHTLGVACSDLALPSVVFLPEENAVGVFVAPNSDELDPVVRIAASLDETAWVRVEDMRDELGTFVDECIARARAAHVTRWADWLDRLWVDSQRRERDPQERLRASLGEFAAQHWAEATAELAADAEALRGVLLDTEPVREQAAWLRHVEAVAGSRGAARETATQWPRPAGTAGLPPYAQGQQLAVALREALGKPAEPIDLRDSMEALGVRWRRTLTKEFRSAAIRTGDGATCVLIGAEMAGLARQRFAIAAALGRLLADAHAPGVPFGAAHGAASRVRETQRANAFAAELLLPKAALQERGERDVRELCDDFGISVRAAEWQIANRASPEAAM